jgi:lipoprotein-releasing system ATP-binding protein
MNDNGAVIGNKMLLEGRDIVKSYPTPRGELTVLNGASLSVEHGEMLAVMGASGSGKSTLLHVLGVLDSIDSGMVLFNGQDISLLSETSKAELRNRKIGFIFQFYHLLSDFSALDNVLMPSKIGRLMRGTKKREFQDRAKELLKIVGLEDRMLHRPFELSGGEQQRVAIARALLNNPDIVLADEPTGNLDPNTGRAIYDLLRKLNSEHKQTMIIVTHNPGLAGICSRVTYIVGGRITEEQPAGF